MATIYQFGKFVLNVQEQLLTADGRAMHLPTKEFETLQMLVENNGKVLSKDEMMSAIWKDTFVEESNLAQYVSRLRKILNSGGAELIETIPPRLSLSGRRKKTGCRCRPSRASTPADQADAHFKG